MLAYYAKTKHSRREICDVTNCLDTNIGGITASIRRKKYSLPVIIVPDDLRKESTKPDGAQVSFSVSFFHLFSKLNYWCQEQMRIQNSEPLQQLQSVSSWRSKTCSYRYDDGLTENLTITWETILFIYLSQIAISTVSNSYLYFYSGSGFLNIF